MPASNYSNTSPIARLSEAPSTDHELSNEPVIERISEVTNCSTPPSIAHSLTAIAVADRVNVSENLAAIGLDTELVVGIVARIPTNSETETNSGLDGAVALGLGFIPLEMAELIIADEMYFSNEGLAQIRNRLQLLAKQNNPIDPNTPEAWWLCGQAMIPGRMVTIEDYSRQRECWEALRSNAEVRSEIATGELKRWQSSFSFVSEFGQGVAFSIQPDDREPGLFESKGIYLGCNVAVTYSPKLGIYYICTANTVPGFEDLDIGQFNSGVNDRPIGPISAVSAIALDRQGVSKILKMLRQAGELSEMTEEDRRLPGLPFKDRINTERRHFFFAAGSEELHQIEYREQLKIKVSYQPETQIAKSLYPQALWVTLPHLSTEVFPQVVGRKMSNLVVPLVGELTKTQRDNINRQLSRVTSAELVLWDNGRATMHFDQPFNVAKEAVFNGHSRSNGKPGSVTIFGIQSLATTSEWHPLVEQPSLAYGLKRFSPPRLELDYPTVGKLKVGVAINQLPLHWAYSSKIEELGYPRAEGRKINCLTDFRNLALPLVKPNPGDLDNPEFEGARLLSHLSEDHWIEMLQSLVGRQVEDLVEVTDIGRECHEESRGVVRKHREISIRPSGAIYQGPCDSVSIVGKYLVYHCQVADREFSFVDRFRLGDALYGFWDRDQAIRAASHFSSGGLKREVWEYPSLMLRLPHRQGHELALLRSISQAWKSHVGSEFPGWGAYEAYLTGLNSGATSATSVVSQTGR